MNTRFGKIISGKNFSKIFLLVFLILMCVGAHRTDRAICWMLGVRHTYGVVYLAFGIFGVLVMARKKVCQQSPAPAYQKMVGFLSCFLIYYVLPVSVWSLVCVLSRASEKTAAMGTILWAAASLLIVLGGFLHTRSIATVSYAVELGDRGQAFRLALLSDIHLGAFVGVRHVEKIVRLLNQMQPDMVIIAGDLFDVDNVLLKDAAGLKQISMVLRKIKAPKGVFAVMGNHDPQMDNRVFRRFLKDANIQLLDNRVTKIAGINLIGRSDPANHVRRPLSELLAQCDPDKPVVVIDHDPQGIREAAEQGTDLVLCGHTHRGQFFPVTIFTRWANGAHYFYGHEVFGHTQAMISSGVGFFGLPVRIGTNNEIVDIRIRV